MEIKYVILFLTSVSQFSFRTFVDYPSLLATEIKDYFDVDQLQINLLFSFRTMPNIVMPFVGGMILDRIGNKRGMLGFLLCIFCGTLLCYLSLVLEWFPLMLLGRLVMGFFLESCYVGIYKILAHWFKEAAFAYSIDTVFVSGGTIASTIVLPYLVNDGLQYTLLICLLICLVAFAALSLVTYLNGDTKSEESAFNFRQLFQFNIDFYLIMGSSVFCYNAYYLFQFNNVEMFKTIYHLTPYQAATLYGLPSYMSIFLAPYFGHLIDKYGHRMQALQITSLVQLSVFALFYLAPPQGLVIASLGQLLNGAFFAAYVVILWPCITIPVSPQLAGTALGVVYSSINLGMTIFSVVVGKIVQRESQESYSNMLILILVLALLGGSMNYALYYRERKYFNNKKYTSKDIELKMLD